MDIKLLKDIVNVFENSTAAVMEVEAEDIKVKLEKPTSAAVPQAVVTATPQQEPVQEKADDKYYLRAPMVGTFYAAPSADSQPFVKVGDFVNAGDTVCIIEAMKVMNEIKADKSGRITEIMVKNGDMVQYDQPIVTIGDSNDS